MSVAAVVLAAGASKRLGAPKQDLRLGPETLLERTVRVAREAGLEPVFVVLGPRVSSAPADGVKVLVNHLAAEGMASSVRVGIAACIGVDAAAAVLLACDQPFVTPEHLRTLADAGDEIVASAYAGHHGVPAYFPARAFKELMLLRGDTGARELLREVRSVPLYRGELDIDTAEDMLRVRELFAADPKL